MLLEVSESKTSFVTEQKDALKKGNNNQKNPEHSL